MKHYRSSLEARQKKRKEKSPVLKGPLSSHLSGMPDNGKGFFPLLIVKGDRFCHVMARTKEIYFRFKKKYTSVLPRLLFPAIHPIFFSFYRSIFKNYPLFFVADPQPVKFYLSILNATSSFISFFHKVKCIKKISSHGKIIKRTQFCPRFSLFRPR